MLYPGYRYLIWESSVVDNRGLVGIDRRTTDQIIDVRWGRLCFNYNNPLSRGLLECGARTHDSRLAHQATPAIRVVAAAMV